MTNIFKEYGKVIVAILISVAVLVLILVNNFLKDSLAAPAKKDTNIEHQANEEEFRNMSYKLVPAVVVKDDNRKIAKDEIFNPLEKVTGVSYLVDNFGDVQYEKNEDGSDKKATDMNGNYLFDENGRQLYVKAVDTENEVTVTIPTVEVKGEVEVDGVLTETITTVPDIRYRKTNSEEFELLTDISGTEGISLNLEHIKTHTNTEECECGYKDGVVTNEKFYNTPGQYLVRYRAVDENNAEAFVEILYIVDGSLKANEDGALIGGSGK